MIKVSRQNACHISYLPICDICGKPIPARTDKHHAWAVFKSSEKEELDVYFVHRGLCHKKAMHRIESEGGVVGDVDLERFLLATLRELSPTAENIRCNLLFRPNPDEDEQLYTPDELFTW